MFDEWVVIKFSEVGEITPYLEFSVANHCFKISDQYSAIVGNTDLDGKKTIITCDIGFEYS